MNYTKQFGLIALMAACVFAAGCGHTVSRNVSNEGTVGEVVFPSTDRIVLKEGTFPTVEALRQIGPGVTKDQLYALVGRPHFHEGISAREWDYLFHFRTPAGVTTCQYKVVFDSSYHGQNFYWSPESCANVLNPPPPPAPVQVAAPAAPAVTRFDLSGDALFQFGRSARTDILPGGREQLAAIARQLAASKASIATVVGHTDYIGSRASNQALSQRRADSVRAILIEHGVAASAVTAVGAGSSQPVQQCDAGLPRAELVGCLQPNRRVEIIATGIE